MPGVRRMLPLFVAIAVIAGLAGCGSDEKTPTVPEGLASSLLEPLNAAKDADDAGNCPDVQENAKAFSDQVVMIGADEVDPAVKQKLLEAAASLKDLAQTDCADAGTGATIGGVAPDDQQAEEPSETSTETSTSSSTTSTTSEEPDVAAKPKKPAGKQPAKAENDAKPAKPGKGPKNDNGNGPKHNGPPGPQGNPNHGAPAPDSGGVSPEGGG